MNFHLYPNPASDYVYLENVKECCKASLLNMGGQTIRILQIDGTDRPQFKMSDLDKGIYFVRIIDRKNVIHTKKIIKK